MTQQENARGLRIIFGRSVGHCRQEPKQGNGSENTVGRRTTLILLRNPTPTRPTNPLENSFCARGFFRWDNRVGQSSVLHTVQGRLREPFLADRGGVAFDLPQALVTGHGHYFHRGASGLGHAPGGCFPQAVGR